MASASSGLLNESVVLVDESLGPRSSTMLNSSSGSSTRNGRLNCEDLRAPDYVFVLLSLTLLIVAGGAVFFNFLFLTLLRRTAIFHQNVRALLVNAELGTTLAAGCLVLRATFYHWPVWAMGFDYLALHSSSCALLECLYIIGIVSMMLSLFGIGLERLCATWRWTSPPMSTTTYVTGVISGPDGTSGGGGAHGTVGMKRRRTLQALTRQRSAMGSGGGGGVGDTGLRVDRIGPFVKTYLFITWMAGIGYVGLFYWSAMLLDQTLCYCHLALAVTEDVLYGSMASWLALAIFTLLLYCSVLRRNRRHLLDFTINTARHNLQERFLAWHNVTITAMLLPAVITNAVLSGSFFTALMLLYNNDFRHSANSILALVAIVHILAAAMLLHPILTTRTCEKLRVVACKQYPRLRPLWMVGQAQSSGKYSTTSMRGITIAEPQMSHHSEPGGAHGASSIGGGGGGTTELSEHAGPARKKPSDSIIIDYRIDPDQHRQLIERLWSMKD